MLTIMVDSLFWILLTFIGILSIAFITIVVIFIVGKRREKRKEHAFDYFSKILHDLKTPIYAIDGFTLLATNSINDSVKTKEYLNKISNISRHMLSLVMDVLDLSKLNNDKLEITNTIESLPNLIDDCLNNVEPQMLRRNIQFKRDIQITHNKIIVDKLHLIQILTNLLSNAIKYTEPEGTISLTILEQQKNEETSTYIFKVQDTGYGMSEEFQQHIFEPFAQERVMAHTDVESSGLGLFLVKKFVDLMNGTIEVESKQNEGSCFTIVIDLDFIF
ncbi:MAG: HAMP domain-containing histidine kinase [Roseburia sp.]|nr:HAMP domain-containing histidine kinase [Anaeroplasma bactoclasticum]MCM1196871.1 HAMP domain-containing histidine kinase [Roseburia sp.]MCM1556099.1 HAMP domain-containing histidine kinase [Anaeroplasma bactoclasticum]